MNPEATNRQMQAAMMRTCRPLTEEQFLQTGLEIAPQWIELAESLKFLDENRKKLTSLEFQIDTQISQQNEQNLE